VARRTGVLRGEQLGLRLAAGAALIVRHDRIGPAAGAVGRRQPKDLSHDGAELLVKRAGIVRKPVALADLADLDRDLGIAGRKCRGTGGARSGETGSPTGRGTASTRSGSLSRASAVGTRRRGSPRRPRRRRTPRSLRGSGRSTNMPSAAPRCTTWARAEAIAQMTRDKALRMNRHRQLERTVGSVLG
jgi:hypothetical protein